jgi:hypothetical protein
MKKVYAQAPMSSKAKAVLRDRGQAREVFATVLQTRSVSGESRRYTVSGLKYRTEMPARKASGR